MYKNYFLCTAHYQSQVYFPTDATPPIAANRRLFAWYLPRYFF